MPLQTQQFTLGTATASKICVAEAQSQTVWVHNEEHSQSDAIYIGNASVSTATGFHLDSEFTIKIELDPGSDLWAISDTDSSIVHVLAIKQD